MKTKIRIKTLILLAILNCPSLFAQDCDPKIFFLEAIKGHFLYHDTIITHIDQKQIVALNDRYKSVQVLDCNKQIVLKDVLLSNRKKYLATKQEFQIQSDSEIEAEILAWLTSDRNRYYCYSFYKSSDNWYTLTFLSPGHYVPSLIFVNYDPQGRFNVGSTLFSRFIDAGEYAVTESSLQRDSLFVSDVLKSEKLYPSPDRFTHYTDSTITRYFFRKSGKMEYIDKRSIKFEK